LTEIETFREKLLQIITENPGLYFRELQRKTGSAVGKLDYHLYQMERKGEIYSMKDEHVVRYFSSASDTMLERRLAVHLRNPVSKEIITRAAVSGEYELSIRDAKALQSLEGMKQNGIVSYTVEGEKARVSLENRDIVIKFLKRYSSSFLDSIAYSIFKMLDEI
jgi:predicted transcriptional regulator